MSCTSCYEVWDQHNGPLHILVSLQVRQFYETTQQKLKILKAEIEPLHYQLQSAQAKMLSEFDSWLASTQLQKASSAGSDGREQRVSQPKIRECTVMVDASEATEVSTQSQPLASERQETQPSSSVHSSPEQRDLEHSPTLKRRVSLPTTGAIIMEPDRNTTADQLRPLLGRTSAEEQQPRAEVLEGDGHSSDVSTQPPESIPLEASGDTIPENVLTGIASADEEIRRFYAARTRLLAKASITNV